MIQTALNCFILVTTCAKTCSLFLFVTTAKNSLARENLVWQSFSFYGMAWESPTCPIRHCRRAAHQIRSTAHISGPASDWSLRPSGGRHRRCSATSHAFRARPILQRYSDISLCKIVSTFSMWKIITRSESFHIFLILEFGFSWPFYSQLLHNHMLYFKPDLQG